MKSYTLIIAVDRYWPSRGGLEQATLALAASLPSEWRVTIVTHRPSTAATLYGNLTSSRKMPANDPSGNVIEPLDAGHVGRLLLSPLLIRNIPLMRRVLPRLLFDLLYIWYKTAFSRRLERLLDDADSVHCISTGYLARCVTDVCLKKGIRFVHEPFIHFSRWGDSPAQLRAYAAADTVICPTKSFKTKFLARIDSSLPVNVAVIPPVVVEPSYPKLRMPPVPGRFVLFLGRREAHKGLASLLVAFGGLDHLASLVIAGPGEQVRIRNMAVFDLGEVDDKIKDWLLSSCDVLCVPSTDESFGIVFTEAMSFGKPVIGFDVAPINEIVKNGESGLLVPPDDTDSLHRALETLLTDGRLQKHIGAAAKERYDRIFSRAVVIGKIIALHERKKDASSSAAR
ncbi:MAG: glycosyltransferase family 4 protein [Chitinispirillaceae bacterium]|nr:glycosyltransferase family 4 protein [Chitinispirillaceae bacterium]